MNGTAAHFQFTHDEGVECATLSTRVVAEYGSVDSVSLYGALPLYCRSLPERLVALLSDLRLTETAGYCLLSGYPIGTAIGETPQHWEPAGTQELTAQAALVLMAAVLGEPFAWTTLQDGRVVQDLLPIRDEETGKSGNSSNSVLDLHTEDAFDSNRCDYLGLMCLRNLDSVPTKVASLDSVVLTRRQREVLSQPRFAILPDSSHVEGSEKGASGHILRYHAVLFGDWDRPYLRFDSYFTQTAPGDIEARRALDALSAELERVCEEVILAPGDILFMDNYRVVHGRGPFHARYDGSDRWLKRINVTRDLRKSRALRALLGARTVMPEFMIDQ